MKIHYIDIMGTRPLVLNNSAGSAIEDEFGGMDGLGDAMVNKPCGTLNKLLKILLNGGRKYCEIMNIDIPDPLPCEPGDVIDLTDKDKYKEIMEICMAVMSHDDREIEVAPEKN